MMTSAAVIWTLAPLGAHAQGAQAAAPSGGGSAVQEIVVTGTRIQSPNLQSVSPVQVVTSQDIAVGGRTQTIDILNQLPQASFAVGVDFGPTSDALSNPGGSATVDLRGIGPQRTLVLVDGKRLGIGDPNTGNPNPAPDINQIPSALVDRIEVLTGGASATYGSDAVAGVVNFIMKKNFEGVQLDAQWGENQHDQQNKFMQGLLRKFGTPVPGSKWDGFSGDYSLLVGMNSADGKGNVTGYATYFSQDPVFQGARDYSACQLKSTKACTGSSNSNTVYLSDPTSNPPFSENQYTVVGNQFLLYPQAGSTPPPLFNSNPYESLIHKDTRYTGGFLANYEVNDWFKPYLTFQFMHDQTDTQVAPGALFQGTGSQPDGGYLVNCNNPLLSNQEATAIGCTAAQISSTTFNNLPPTAANPGDPTNPGNKDLYFGRRNVEGGPRQFTYNHDNFRVVLGSKGSLWGPFSYELYGSYYDTRVAIDNENFQSIAAVQNALLVKGTAANPVCISGASGCVPYNVFKDGGVTPAQTAYQKEAGTSTGSTTEAIVEGTITGNLGDYGIKSPWAMEGVGLAAGFQVRRDTLTYKPDQAELSNDMSGFGGAAVSINNALGVTEGFGELRVPVFQDTGMFMHDLSLNAAYRYSAYSTGANARTFKGGGEWAPTPDFRFRGGFNRAVRAPSIIELYTPQSVTNTSVVSEDPCAANALKPASLAACLNTGATAANYGKIPQCPANQCAVIQGGNPNLQPETADTYTLGGVFTPRFIPGFQASIDYYHIDLQGIIGNIPLGVSLNNCLAGQATYCANIVRNPVNGILFGTTVGAGGYFVGSNINVASEEVSGLDIQASYRLPLSRFGKDDWGSVNFAMSGSVDMGWRVKPLPGAQIYDCNGLFGPQCQGIFPKWRHTLRATWNAPHNVQASVAWRYYGGATYEADTSQPTIGGNTTPDPIAHTVPAVNYMDLAVSWQIRPKLTIRGGVNNVLDTDPPLIENAIVGGANPNSYPVYDLLGRHFFMSISAKF